MHRASLSKLLDKLWIDEISGDFMTWVVFWGPEGGEGADR